MTRHYKLSTGSVRSNAGGDNEAKERKGRSSLCERYGKDWVTFGKGQTPQKSYSEKENSPDNSFAMSPDAKAVCTVPQHLHLEVEVITKPDALLFTPPISPLAPVFPLMPVTSSAPVPATSSAPPPLSPRSVIDRLPRRLAEFSSEDVVTWASSTSLAPEVVACLRDNAVNGAVLETLSEVDLKKMGLPRLASWLALWSQRTALQTALKSGQQPPAEVHVQTAPRHRVVTGSVTVSIGEPPSPCPNRGVLQRTASAPRSCSGTLPPRARSPLRSTEVTTSSVSLYGGTCSARTVSLKRVMAPMQATVHTTSQSYTPGVHTPQKPTNSFTGSIMQPIRASSAIRARPQESSLCGTPTPRSSSCIRTRIEYHAPHAPYAPTYSTSSLPVATASAVPIVSAAPAGSVLARPPVQPLGMQVTVRPLSPSSDRIRQGPPCRRVRSIDHLDNVAGSQTPSGPRQGVPPSPNSTDDADAPPHPAVMPSAEAIQEALNNPQGLLKPATAALADDVEEEPSADAEAKGETIFGDVVKSWGRICSEMAKSSEEDFDNLQRQLNALFTDEQKALGAGATASEDCD